jgi:hypothetical protein
MDKNRVNEEYEDDQFEREDVSPPPKANIPPTSHNIDEKDSTHETPNQSSPVQH